MIKVKGIFFCPEVTLHLLGDFTGLRETEGYRKSNLTGQKRASVGKQGRRSADMTHPVREQSPGETRQEIFRRMIAKRALWTRKRNAAANAA